MNMATIQPIEARSVHQIQSGQVIVDLCSVVKELVENSLDAGATSIDVRFKNNGLDLIEVQDNGDGISPNNYETVALKHYTSKLSTFEDLTSLQTFGFRGEALSSLCALSNFRITTAKATQAPRATRLEFETSGNLKNSQIVAGQKGTTVSVENLFTRLPVRRRELEKHNKREYGKMLALLHAYACISTGVRFSVKNHMPKGKSAVVFATKSNPTTRENISNVYGAKTLLALMPLDLELEFEPSMAARKFSQSGGGISRIFVHGHISKPVFGEGRQTPDRQMFFVNSRPCGLPQIAKSFNEVYKSFNVSQSPFVFANFEMDTSAYDVNVSPDKRTILLHDASSLLESLKSSLTKLFENQDQTVPQSQIFGSKQSTIKPAAKQVSPSATVPSGSQDTEDRTDYSQELGEADGDSHLYRLQNPQTSMKGLLRKHDQDQKDPAQTIRENDPQSPVIPESSWEATIRDTGSPEDGIENDEARQQEGFVETQHQPTEQSQESSPIRQSQTVRRTPETSKTGIIQNAFDRMRMKRTPADVATITIGENTYMSPIGRDTTPRKNVNYSGAKPTIPKRRSHTPSRNKLGLSIQSFAAPGTQPEEKESLDIEEDGSEGESTVESSHPGTDQEQPSEADYSEREGGLELETHEASASGSDSDGSYIDDEEKKSREEARVKELIRIAEDTAAPSEKNIERANKMSRRSRGKDSTVQLMCSIDCSIAKVEAQMKALQQNLRSCRRESPQENTIMTEAESQKVSPEAKLSLTVSKEDFARMNIIGQFNLGFILATRPHTEWETSSVAKRASDELFIIDQHASDEKYNFERLQAETIVQNQRLVQPKQLDLTAVEEEVVIDNLATLEKNGFIVEIDTSGDEPIGRRCKLISLPLSKEVVFNIRDLEELIVLLSESPQPQLQPQWNEGETTSSPFADQYVSRPDKVRKMFAMRACRSSIMVGKTLTHKQMEKVVRHMGMIDKPWNCPHGRPTMRHLMSLGQWNDWGEWDHRQSEGKVTFRDENRPLAATNGSNKKRGDVWKQFLEDYGD